MKSQMKTANKKLKLKTHRPRAPLRPRPPERTPFEAHQQILLNGMQQACKAAAHHAETGDAARSLLAGRLSLRLSTAFQKSITSS